MSAPAAVVAVVAILVVAIAAFTFIPGSANRTTTVTTAASTSVAGAQGISCANTAAWAITQNENAYGGDTLSGTTAINDFQAGTQNVGWSDLTTTTSGTASKGTYPLDGSYITQITETSTVLTYPIWGPLQASGTVPSKGQVLATMGGNIVLVAQCAPSTSNSNANIWNIIATPIQAPTSGTSATTNVKVVCTNGNGNSLTTASTAFPTSSVLISCLLNLYQAYRGAGYNIPIYGTQQNPVQNFASTTINGVAGGATTYSGAVQRQMIALIMANNTNVQDSLDSTASCTLVAGQLTSCPLGSTTGLTLTPVPQAFLATSTRAWIASGFTGCAPVGSTAGSSTPIGCLLLPMQMYTNTHTGHLAVQIEFVDMQDLSYVLNNLVTVAQGSFGSSTSSQAGACTGFSAGLTPTSNQDAGSPAALIKACYDILNA